MDYADKNDIINEIRKLSERVDALGEKSPEEKKAEILAIKDRSKRLKAINDNLELFQR